MLGRSLLAGCLVVGLFAVGCGGWEEEEASRHDADAAEEAEIDVVESTDEQGLSYNAAQCPRGTFAYAQCSALVGTVGCKYRSNGRVWARSVFGCAPCTDLGTRLRCGY